MSKFEFKKAYGSEFEVGIFLKEEAQEAYSKVATDKYVGEKHKLVTITSQGQVLVRHGKIQTGYDRYTEAKVVLGMLKDANQVLTKLVVVTTPSANEKECLNVISSYGVSDVNIFDAVVEEVLEEEVIEPIIVEEVIEEKPKRSRKKKVEETVEEKVEETEEDTEEEK